MPSAKYNEEGNIVSNPSELKSFYVRKYKDRLRHREIDPGYSNLKVLKENLFLIRLQLSKERPSPPWNDNQLSKVLSSLKSNKARDASGLIFKVFQPNVAGADLVRSQKMLCNGVKREFEVPVFLEKTNITSIYKNKGSRMEIDNDRGIFNVSKVRSIIDKLVYNDYYHIIDGNMSDSNIGVR